MLDPPATRAARPSPESPTRQKILKVAAELFARSGYSGVGMNEIGEASELGRGALYYHITSKEQLLYDITSTYMSGLVTGGRDILEREGEPAARVRSLSRHLMRMIADHKPELTVCFREMHALTGELQRRVLTLHADYQRVWSTALAEGVGAGAFRPITAVTLKGLLGMYFYSFLWLDPCGPQTPEAIGEALADIVLRTVRADAGEGALP